MARSAVVLAAFAAVLSGCAAPGEPSARHPVVPQPVRDLSARQQGNGVVLSFALPADSTDKKPLGETPTIDIYRSVMAPAATPGKPPNRPADTIPADLVDTYKTGAHIEFRDELDPAELARQPGQQVTYTIRTRLSGEHASADSNPAKLTVYLAPQPPSALHATLMEKSIALSWTPSEAAPGAPTASVSLDYRVYRAEVSAGVSAAAAQPNTAEQSALQPIALAQSSFYDDVNVSVGRTYRYVVRSVAKFGEQSVESLDSNDAVIAANDVFPPTVPQNLVAIIIPATDGQPAYIELSWSISSEADLAGYEVFRSTDEGTQGERLNSELLSAPTFRDTNVTAGRRYFYQVRAVDQAGNASPLSATVQANLAEP